MERNSTSAISHPTNTPKFHTPNSTVPTTETYCCCTQRKEEKRKEDERREEGEGELFSVSLSQSVPSATNSTTIAFGDASAQPASQPASLLQRGSAGGEERGRAAEVQSRKERDGDDGRTNERPRRRKE